jgi:hypothetical protein
VPCNPPRLRWDLPGGHRRPAGSRSDCLPALFDGVMRSTALPAGHRPMWISSGSETRSGDSIQPILAGWGGCRNSRSRPGPDQPVRDVIVRPSPSVAIVKPYSGLALQGVRSISSSMVVLVGISGCCLYIHVEATGGASGRSRWFSLSMVIGGSPQGTFPAGCHHPAQVHHRQDPFSRQGW